ncbi:MAG TPA: sigma-54 dependent transcriptional regulator, partial [Spirochaetota bacterium]|nr:sigma-54 dependent transcriptional regulator [Spirochaetota bacterium]
IRMHEMNGIDLLKKIVDINRNIYIIVITAYGSIENAVECMKIGAFDFLTKPFQSDELIFILNKITERKKLLDENKELRQKLEQTQNNTIIGKSKKITDIVGFAQKLSDTKHKILITGESGTGKDVLAKFIHTGSKRSEKPFIAVQCGLLPESLLESELFGHKKGSFTGAFEDKIGLFEEANGGTVFLDEIGDINLSVQAKLLRFIQENEVRKIGDNKSKIVDVRLISATNKDLKQLIKENKFREDLYYRLNVISIHLPPLRERKEDIPLLVNHFIKQINRENQQNIEIDNSCYDYLINYKWVGNIRELRNCLENASAICENNKIMLRDIEGILNNNEDVIHYNSNNQTFKEAKSSVINEFEKNFLINCLTNNDGNITKTSIQAGIDKKNFWVLLKKHNIDYKNSKK